MLCGSIVLTWKSGSATPKKTSPIPIPALINIEYQAKFEYSGLAFGPPNLISPNLLIIKNIGKSRNMFTEITKNQLRLPVIFLCNPIR